eukprot:7389465-Prymnesium_polylepis.2
MKRVAEPLIMAPPTQRGHRRNVAKLFNSRSNCGSRAAWRRRSRAQLPAAHRPQLSHTLV